MSIPTGPFPAPIDYGDILPGMHIRGTGTYADGVGSMVAEGWVASIDASGITATSGLVLPHDLTVTDGPLGFSSETFELMEAFTGDATEPTANTIVLGADGTVYQRQPDPTNPTASVWVAPNSTTPVTWSAITAAGAPQIILDGSAM